MSYYDILSIKLSNHIGASIELGIIPCIVLFCIIGKALVKNWRRPNWRIVEGEVKLGGIGKIKIKPNHERVRIAYKAWVELTTRKAALPFDEKHDTIVEIYNSWFELFKEMRTLIKDIPAEELRNSQDTRELVRLLVVALNKGLRPHLTEWQAKFRRWYDSEKRKMENENKSPQEIQKGYPDYEKLISNLKEVNKQLQKYAEFIKLIAQGDDTSRCSSRRCWWNIFK